MTHHRLQLGTLTLLFSVILICVAVLGALCVSTARADLAMAEKYQQYVTQTAACDGAGEVWLSQVDAAMKSGGEFPVGTAVSEEEISTVITHGSMTLTIRLRPAQGGYAITQWARQSQWQEETGLNLWTKEA